MTEEQIDIVTLLVEVCRSFAYGYTKPADAREALLKLLPEVEGAIPLRRRGVDGQWVPIENTDTPS